MSKVIQFPDPELQVSFAVSLKQFRATYLQNALLETVSKLQITQIDRELAELVSPSDLSTLAQYGLRGELLFAVPSVLRANPFLLGYYRLLMGYSQKEFYGSDKGFNAGYFKNMEQKGVISKLAEPDITALCKAFCNSASFLLAGVGPLKVSRDLLDDLALLTVGPQLRGGANNQRGIAGIILVFEVIREIVSHAAVEVSDTAIKISNATGRPCLIEFAADPDIIIREEMTAEHDRNIVAIEVKSGTDISNIHNRIGEAEKSHQKAKRRGFNECWTVLNVSKFDLKKAKYESPTTNIFYSLHELVLRQGDEYEDFKRRIISLTSIPSAASIAPIE